MRVLIADDNHTLLEELRTVVEGEGHEALAVGTGRDALRTIETETFDAALLDLKMPGASGLEVLHRVRELGRDTSVVVITGHGTIDTAVEAMKAGAIDFLVKPFDAPDLRSLLTEIEEERRAREVLMGGVDAASVLKKAGDTGRLLAVLGTSGKRPAKAARVLRIAVEASSPDGFAPQQLYQINAAVEAHLASTREPVVYVADLRALVTVHGDEEVKGWLLQIVERTEARGGRVVLARSDHALADSRARIGPVDPKIHGMLESIANPLRGRIVAYLGETESATYTSILRHGVVNSSPKLSFHLQKLVGDGLMAKGADGRYSLTDDGRRAWGILQRLAQARRPTLILAPR